ncbi:hypothetical protein AMTR_s00062p00132710 [Amborella trichopoda]|uniref:Uncharacterized protein n=1 Tax=Amborella trichopoda TaxID=13333 RepID=U5D1X8_AMBTC|nr:hypothetical protein AMTR_s00062p00132710 [Amborella trichopoda]
MRVYIDSSIHHSIRALCGVRSCDNIVYYDSGGQPLKMARIGFTLRPISREAKVACFLLGTKSLDYIRGRGTDGGEAFERNRKSAVLFFSSTCQSVSSNEEEVLSSSWSRSQTTRPKVCDRSEEPLPDTILLPLRTTKKCDSCPAFFRLKKAAVRMRITSEL